jgi:shikimate kinase
VAEHLLLVGMMGAGKSTVARIVAARLGRSLVDTDVEVERVVGSSVREIFSARGEKEFRAQESRVLAGILAGPLPAVVSVGGGAVLAAPNRAALRAGGTVVWLRARPETLARRVGRKADRPLLAGAADGPAAALARIDDERRVLYEEVASAVVDVDALTPGAVADRVIAAAEHAGSVTPADDRAGAVTAADERADSVTVVDERAHDASEKSASSNEESR